MQIDILIKQLELDDIKLEVIDGVYYLNGWAFAEDASPFEIECMNL